MLLCCINQHPNESGNIHCSTCDSLLAGARIGDYRVVSYIGKGSTGNVYLAEENSLRGRKVAIKILHRSCREEFVKSFRKEAKLLASLSHPYILPIFAYGVVHEETKFTSDYVPYLVVQFAEQGSLAESFQQHGNQLWSLDRVTSLTRDVAVALDYAHSRNVLHRDVKPANLLQIGSHVLLCDFSVASLIDTNVSHLSIELAGSPAFMAPEVWAMRPGRYSDQYALAITCFYLLTGNYPLRKNESSNMFAWQQVHSHMMPASLAEFRADLPLAVDVVLQKAMAKNPHERYPTVHAFALDLLNASQAYTQHPVKPPLSALPPHVHSRPIVAENMQGNPQAFLELQPVEVSLADTPATEPLAIPVSQGQRRRVSSNKEAVKKIQGQGVDSPSTKTWKRSNRWIYCALSLNIVIVVMLIIEYSLLVGFTELNSMALLTLYPTLLIGFLLALLFRRIHLTTFSWSLFWGIFYGMTNALLSFLACMTSYSLIVQLQGNNNGGLSGFFNSALQFITVPRVVVLLLLALWMSVAGGAVIGIFNGQGEAARRISHP